MILAVKPKLLLFGSSLVVISVLMTKAIKLLRADFDMADKKQDEKIECMDRLDGKGRQNSVWSRTTTLQSADPL